MSAFLTTKSIALRHTVVLLCIAFLTPATIAAANQANAIEPVGSDVSHTASAAIVGDSATMRRIEQLLQLRAPPPPDQFLFDFQDLSLNEGFSPTHQPYENVVEVGGVPWGITIDAIPNGDPRVIAEIGSQKVLKNIGESEFGTSEYSNLHIYLQGFMAERIDVDVGMEGADTFPVTAQLVGYYDNSPIAFDTYDFGTGPAAVQHLLRIGPAAYPFDRIMISYGYTDSGSSMNAQQSEVIDDLYIRVYEEEPPPPPPDETDPVIHILRPAEGDIVGDGWITGYVVEERGLDSLIGRNLTMWQDITFIPYATLVDGEQRYMYYGRLPLQPGPNTLRVVAEDHAGNGVGKSVNVTYEPPEYYPPPPEWPAALDFKAAGMEVTQAIQHYYNIDDPIVAGAYAAFELPAGKKTLVRVYADVFGVEEPVADVHVALHAYDIANSMAELPGSPIYPARTVTLDPDESWMQRRKDPDKTFNFILPTDWTYGNTRLQAVVNEWNAIPEANYDHYNNATADVLFTETEDLCVFVHRIASDVEGDVIPSEPAWTEVETNLEVLRHIYPVTTANLVIHDWGTYTTDRYLNTGNDDDDDKELGRLADDFRRHLGRYYGQATAAICANDVFLGLTDHSVPHRGVTQSSKQVSLSVASSGDFFKMKSAHEIGHARGLGHVEGCDDPAAPYEYYPGVHDPEGGPGDYYHEASIGNWGVTINTDNTFDLWDPDDTGDMMSYCGGSTDDLTRRYMSYKIWGRLFDGFGSATTASAAAADIAVPKAPPPQPAPHLIVSGYIDEGGTLNPAWQKMALPNDHPGSGPYAIRLLDAQGTELFTRWFEPEPLANVESNGSFYEVMPYFAGVQTIQLIHKINNVIIKILDTVSAGSGAPVVTAIIDPYLGVDWNATGIEFIDWTAIDPNQDQLVYTVFYSRDGGTTWKVIGSDMTNSYMYVNLADLPGDCTNCRVKVMASDGINIGTRISAPFSKDNQPPRVTILGPANGAVFEQHEVIPLEGHAMDMDDIVIPAADMVWSSSRDGSLGTGPLTSVTRLSLGLHTIVLTARDSDQASDKAVTYIYILGNDADDDGIPDTEDPGVNIPCADPADVDQDGMGNSCDNCTLVANPNQRDTNGDGFGNFCDADLNNDGQINFADLNLLKAVFFGIDADADFNGDGRVNFQDLNIMKVSFFGEPGPSGLK